VAWDGWWARRWVSRGLGWDSVLAAGGRADPDMVGGVVEEEIDA
jgi:hypothetical protein